ncbi:hypothetical protein D915_006806 [Fasciola hepatica]|uniref:Uncharacterized protein n=1 Tax=Fasciola hepatica TaxID=6192 RepID=A0A2H1C332_FASHE|nr:hypothetical protein D915_006806 [Fasciola hepatica]
MILLQELKNIYAWRNLITVDHFFEVENQVKVALYFYVPNSSLKDETKNKYLVRELPDRIRYLNLRNGLRSKDIDLQADTPKKHHQLRDGSASKADMEYVS